MKRFLHLTNIQRLETELLPKVFYFLLSPPLTHIIECLYIICIVMNLHESSRELFLQVLKLHFYSFDNHRDLRTVKP